LLIFPRFALTPASFDKSAQATSKQRVGSSNLPGRATYSFSIRYLQAAISSFFSAAG